MRLDNCIVVMKFFEHNDNNNTFDTNIVSLVSDFVGSHAPLCPRCKIYFNYYPSYHPCCTNCQRRNPLLAYGAQDAMLLGIPLYEGLYDNLYQD